MGLFSKTKTPESKNKAIGELLKRGSEEATAPTRSIEQFSGLEKDTQRLAGNFVNSGPNENRVLASKKAQEYANGKDPTTLPEFQAVMDRIRDEGDRSARNLNRSLRLSGNQAGASSKGKDVIGRDVTNTDMRRTEAAMGFLNAERNRQFQSLDLLNRLSEAETEEKLQKMGVGERVGAQMRLLGQAVRDATFSQQMEGLRLRYEVQPNMLRTVASQPDKVSQGALSQVREVAGTVADIGSMGISMGQAGFLGESRQQDFLGARN